MNVKEKKQNDLLGLLDIYIYGDSGKLRIKAESLLDANVRLIAKKAVEDTYMPAQTLPDSDIWEKCRGKWCKNPEEASHCQHWKGFVSRLLCEISRAEEEIFEQVVVLFWYFHASAYERWLDSFDYNCIGCRLHLARQVVDSAIESESDDGNRMILHVLHDLSLQVHHSAYVENAMICNNPDVFRFHAESQIFYSKKIIDVIGAYEGEGKQDIDTNNIAKTYGDRLRGFLIPVIKQHNALITIGELMKTRRAIPSGFTKAWNDKKGFLSQTFKDLEQVGNYEAASEIRAHMVCLEAHHDALATFSPLIMNIIDGYFMYGFYQELGIEQIGYTESELFDSLRSYFEIQGKQFNGCLELLNITEDPPPDILESAIGKEHFKNICLVFQDIEIRNLSSSLEKRGELIITVTPKLFHYSLGIGLLSFECTVSHASIPDFYALKHIASPHSGQYDFFNIGDQKNDLRSESRLNEIAGAVIKKYCEIYLNFAKERSRYSVVSPLKNSIEVEQAWFTHFEIYSIEDKNGKTMDHDDLVAHFEWPGIVAYQRADRASIDDWIKINVPSLELSNLAQIRAHKGDVYIISENHSISYLPDDPKFVVMQYGETTKWVFLIRTLMLFSMNQSHEVIKDLKSYGSLLNSSLTNDSFLSTEEEMEATFDKLNNIRSEVQKHRALTINILEHASSVRVSQYADHGLLLKHAFSETGILRMIQQLQERIDGLANIQEGFSVVYDKIKEKRDKIKEQKDKKLQRKLNFFLVTLTLVQIVGNYEVIFNVFAGGKPKNLIIPWLTFLLSSILLIVVISIFYYPLIDKIKRTVCGKKNKHQPE